VRMMSHMIDQLPTADPATLCEEVVDSVTSNSVYED